PAFVVREYAYQHPEGDKATGDVRADFTETLYWHPAVVLAGGKGEVKFNLCDSVTSFRVAVVGHTLDGRLGAFTGTLDSRLPFTIDPKVPVEVSSTDKIDLPVTVVNNTADGREVTLKVAALAGLKLRDGSEKETRLNVAAGERRRQV